MKFEFEEKDYKETYFKYIWISIGIAVLIFALRTFLNKTDIEILKNMMEIEYIYIVIAALSGISAIYLVFSLFFGLPFIIYTSTKKLFKYSYINIDENKIQFVRACNLTSDCANEKERKYKVTRYFNITDIKETKLCYKIKGEIDYFYVETGNLEKYMDKEKNIKELHIKNKSGTFKLPKCFGNQGDLRQQITQMKNVEQLESKKTEYEGATLQGLVDLIVCIIGCLLLMFGNGIWIALGLALAGAEAANGIRVLRETNRDKWFSRINIILAIIMLFFFLIANA